MGLELKNKPLYMGNDEIELLAMHRLRNDKNKLNDKNVDCFISGYKICQLALEDLDNIIDILEYHRKKYDEVKVLIDNNINYGDLRRGYTKEEYSKINRAEHISIAIRDFISALKEVRNDTQENRKVFNNKARLF